jgi:chromosome segregation ATPase
MIEPIVYFGIGFLVAAFFGLLFVPLVDKRAVRLTMRRLEAATPFSIAEIRADKDQLRGEFSISTRRLEMSAEQLKTKMTMQLAELGRKTDAVHHLRKELGQKNATFYALESRDKNLRDQLRVTEEGFELKSGALREAERALADEAEFAQLFAELGERSTTVDSQRVELAALGMQVEALKLSIADYERVVSMTAERLARARGDAEAARKELEEARDKVDGLAARTGELERQLFLQTTEAEILGRRVPDLAMRLGDQGRLLAEREFEIDRLRGDLEAARKAERDLRGAIEERSKLQREIATMKRNAETAMAALPVENALLRERMIDVVAEMARLIAVLEGPDSPIVSLLAVEAPPLGSGTSGVNGNSGEGGAATLDPQQPGKRTIADRICALQSTASRGASN